MKHIKRDTLKERKRQKEMALKENTQALGICYRLEKNYSRPRPM